jgi:arylsulfotransferase ASST
MINQQIKVISSNAGGGISRGYPREGFCSFVLVAFFASAFRVSSQVFPEESRCLNYRIVGFSFPAHNHASAHILEIAAGYYNTEDSFRRNIVVTAKGTGNRDITEVPAFGKNYTWRVRYSGTGGSGKEGLHHFSTIWNERVDTSKTHLKILQPAEKWQDAYVIVEGGGIIYDMQGNPVWCMSDSLGLAGSAVGIKYTNNATLTFLTTSGGHEIDYNSDVVWHTPHRDSVAGSPGPDHYHHDLTRLRNGHYMVLGTEYMFYRRDIKNSSVYLSPTADKNSHGLLTSGPGSKNRIQFGVIMEFDEKGNLVWSWKTSDYLLASDLKDMVRGGHSLKFDAHDNAFFFDEENKVIYIGFRNLSRIVKLSYPDGRVLSTYGAVSQNGQIKQANGLFCGQHSIGLSMEHYLCVFNNNTCHDSAPPVIVMMQEPLTPGDTLKKVWEFVCPVDGHLPCQFPTGGSAMELPDSCLFICMGSEYGRNLLVNRDKKILWSGLPQVYREDLQKWVEPPKTYRSCIISRKELEKMIWYAVDKEN